MFCLMSCSGVNIGPHYNGINVWLISSIGLNTGNKSNIGRPILITSTEPWTIDQAQSPS